MRRCLLLLVVLACAGCGAAPDRDHVISSDLDVLRALTARACTLEWKEIISNVPAMPGSSAPRYGLDPKRRAPASARWPHGALCPTASVASERAIAAVRNEDGDRAWPVFAARFAGAQTLMRISLPVYSKDRRRAVVYVVTTCPYTCGNGFFDELAKTPTGWTIVSSALAWSR